jgi:hypothetical protein
MNKSVVVLPASFFVLLLPLLAAPVGLLRLPFIRRSLFLPLRPRCLLLTLCRLRLLSLLPDCRGSLLRRRLVLRLHVLCRLWLLLLTLDCRSSLLRRGLVRWQRVLCGPWLLPLILDCRTSLLGRGLVRRLRVLDRRTALLERRRTLGSRLRRISHRRCFLPSPLSRCGRFLLLLKVLADYRVTRLIAILLAAQRLLLLHPWVPVS